MLKSKGILIFSSIIVLLLLAIIFSKIVYKSDTSIKIGIQTSPAMALLMIAKDKNFFEEEGADVDLVQFTAGKFALAAFLSGSLDYSVSADVPVTLATLSGNKVIVPAQVVKRTVNEVRVVANNYGKDQTQEEYFKSQKRKLSTSISAGPEFFTYEFLNKIGIGKDDIEIISQDPKDMPISLVNGSVDAISIYDPFAYYAEKEMGKKATTYINSDVYSELYLLETSEKAIKNDFELKKIIRALIKAEIFTRENPDEAKLIVMAYTKLDKKTLDSIWGSYDFSIALTKQLENNLNKQTVWAKKVGKVDSNLPDPDFSKVIYKETLYSLDTSRVER